MTRDDVLRYCLDKPGAWLDEPWDGDTVVKVASKVFAFMGGPETRSVGVKSGANRDEADEWIQRYPHDVQPMAYIGRSGWNSIAFGGAISDEDVREAIDASYSTVVAKLPKRERPQ